VAWSYETVLVVNTLKGLYVWLEDQKKGLKKCLKSTRWLLPVILATGEAEIRRITVWGQPRQIVH
jgi:hypothetical protein